MPRSSSPSGGGASGESALSSLLELSRDALAQVSSSGELLPANESMRSLLRGWCEESGTAITAVRDIPVQPRDREAFEELTRSGAGRAALCIGRSGSLFEIELERTRKGYLLALRDAAPAADSQRRRSTRAARSGLSA